MREQEDAQPRPNQTCRDHVHPPERLTQPCSSFFRSHVEMISFVGFIGTVTEQLDEGAMRAAKVLHGYANDPNEKARYEKILEHKGAAQKAFRQRYHQLLVQMMLCRTVDNYMIYLAELMAMIFRTKPETLRSSETVRVDDILQYSSMVDLISSLTERRVERLSYQGMRYLSEYFDERLGCGLYNKEEDLETAIHIIEMRNIIVHNRAVVNRIYLSRIPNVSEKLGEHISLPGDTVIDYMEFLAGSASDIDQRAAKKFGLPDSHWGPPFNDEEATNEANRRPQEA